MPYTILLTNPRRNYWKNETEHGQYAKVSAVKYILHHKFVPVEKPAFYERMKKDTNSNTEWFNGGCPAKIDPPEEVTNSILLNMKEDGPTNGNTMTSSQLHEYITKFHVKNCIERLK